MDIARDVASVVKNINAEGKQFEDRRGTKYLWHVLYHQDDIWGNDQLNLQQEDCV